MKVREVIRLLEEKGWYLAATRGSHRQFKHRRKPNRVTVAGKMSDNLAPGTLNRHSETGWTDGEAVMRFAVVIEKAGNNYSAYVPDLPGCVATAPTVEAVESEIREAIRFHIEGLEQDGQPVPEPTSLAEYVDA